MLGTVLGTVLARLLGTVLAGLLGTVLGTVLGGVADWMPLLPSSECACVSYVTVCVYW